jgi:uncharacterized RDD family membrane protein YckC
MIDTLCSVETPEGVELEFSPAGPVPRALAWLADLGIRAAVYLGLFSVLALLGRVGIGILLVATFLLEWFYPVAFEVLAGGQTPGKRLLGLRVLRADGAPVGWSRSMVRSLLATVDFLPVGYAAGLVAVVLGRRCQRLGDLAAGTVVVHAGAEPGPRPDGGRILKGNPGRAQGPLPAPRPADTVPGGPPLPPPLPLSLPEQRAVIGFAERAPALTPERARELADLLEPLTGARGDAAVDRLYAMARHLRGQA